MTALKLLLLWTCFCGSTYLAVSGCATTTAASSTATEMTESTQETTTSTEQTTTTAPISSTEATTSWTSATETTQATTTTAISSTVNEWCSTHQGTCQDPTDPCLKFFAENFDCPPDEKCCMPEHIADAACLALGDNYSCKEETQCTGTTIDGLCGGTATRKCCVT